MKEIITIEGQEYELQSIQFLGPTTESSTFTHCAYLCKTKKPEKLLEERVKALEEKLDQFLLFTKWSVK